MRHDARSGRAWSRLALVLAGLACAGPAPALEWPLDAPRPAATFGTPARGRFVAGIALAADGALVRAAGEGELVYYRDGPSAATRLPSVLGSFAVVEHERGLAAVYAGLAPGSVSSYLGKVKGGQIIGAAGASGWAEGPGLFFSLYDRGAARWVNPYLLLPRLKDATPPNIRSAALVRDGKSYPLGETKSVRQGGYAIAVDIADPLDAPWSAGAPAPFYVRLVVDGTKIAELRYDIAEGRKGSLFLFPEAPRSREAYLAPDGRAILAERTFTRGRSSIEILVRDFAGNERAAAWVVGVE